MKLRILLLLLLITSVCTAQTIPNWTKTSSAGAPFTLHDVLSSGNAVTLIFFATWLSPAQLAFSQLETLWDDYDNGNCGLYVFGMDQDNSETNAQINVFLTNNGATFPAFAGCQSDFSYYDINFSPNQGFTPLTLVIVPDTGNPANSTVVWSQVGWGTGQEIIQITTALSNNGLYPCGNMTISISNIDNATCNDSCDGEATATVTGGTPPYSYQWDDPSNQTTATATGLCAGVYNVTVSDSAVYSISTAVTVNQPVVQTSATYVLLLETSPNCDGQVYVVANGGTAPYSYQWDDPGNQTDSLATGLCAGTYHLINNHRPM